MTLADLIEEKLTGREPDVTADLRPEYDRALAGHEALLFAVGETIGLRDADRPPPELPPDYEVIGELGRGGMGVVYLARQRSLGREVAVKVLRPGPETRDRLVKRFLDEARHMAQLRHPNIVAVHEIGRVDEEPYFTMDFVPGESLAARLAGGRLKPAQAVAVVKQVVAAVVHAHEHGIIHRDLKPGNVLLDSSGRAYVTDFGLARDVTTGSDLTRPGELLGTPSYMAPEQARGQTELIGEGTDVHAIGAVLYEALTGRPPYGHDAPAAVFARLLHEDPASPRSIDRRIPRDLETICLKCLEKDPAKRYPTARAVLEDLRRYEAGEPITAKRPGPLDRVGRLARRQWKLLATAAVTAAIAAGLALYFANPSADTLRAWGQEREARGDYAGAIDVYRRAWEKAKGADRDAARQDVIRCISKTDDAKAAVEAARAVIKEDPLASFGKYDYLIAQAVATELRTRHGGSVAAASVETDRPLLQLAETRLKVFLNSGNGTAEERKEAELTLAAVAHILAGRPQGRPQSVVDEAPDYKLPEGTPEELRRMAADPKAHPWERGKAAYVLARKADEADRAEEARKEAARAFELLRSVYPMYSGVASVTVVSPITENRIGREADEAGFLRQAHDLAVRLDPDRKPTLRGGIRFKIDGMNITEELAASVNVILIAEGVKADQWFGQQRTVPFYKDRAEVGVADGTYTLRLEGWSMSIPPGQERFVRLMEFDTDCVPQTVTIDGKFIDVTIPARQLDEVELHGPAAGTAYDPTTDFLRWGEVPGAAYYRVQLNLQQDYKDGRSITGLPEVKVKSPRVCLGTLDDADAARRAEKLLPGRILTWSVVAYDKDDRKIAVSLDYGRPLVLTKGVGR
jgi:predicted Ser/Thr protein kinase/tetratricopeptide (TPR) repeat protein